MRARVERLRRRIVEVAAAAFILGLVALAVTVTVSYVAVHETAKSEFCVSCHIMEPYYESWQNSSHSNVACIECHYEPGAVETFEGKFKALSQLSKYITRTQGTKPWAEVSDTSCMRSGCHSVRLLEGEVQFGRVKFDHRHHLLEARRGRRLRCVSCHSQIVQGEHVSVTESVCFMCHFMPSSDGNLLPATSDCETCHGAPSEDVLVNGRPFSHSEYVARGVDCRECHSPVIEGTGVVRRERCHSCHGEVGHVERIGETAFMHETHVTDHKVECFECHDEIRHGLLPLATHEPVEGEGCGSCHQGSHGAASLLYAGTGAVGLADAPSRMYETRVVCEACHTGRADRWHANGVSSGAGPHDLDWDAPREMRDASAVAKAGNLDCVHCHGPGFDGMLTSWQSAIGEQLDRVGTMLSELEERLPDDGQHPAMEPYLEARQNLELLTRDGSRGAHNPPYALGALEAGADRIDRAFELLGVEPETPAAGGFPFRSAHGCSTCHLGIERADFPATGASFPHRPHLEAAALDCDACHDVESHGEPAFDRADCASCHHRETPQLDPWECSSCHATQSALVEGALTTFAGLADSVAAPMAAKECTDCHGEPPDIVRPNPALCALCHEAGYDELPATWRERTRELAAELAAAIEAAGPEVDPGTLDRARAVLAAVESDGSHGAHNPDVVASLLQQATEALNRK